MIDLIIIFVGFLLLCFSMLNIVSLPNTSGFEISVYSSYSNYFWYSFIASYVCGVLIIILSIYDNKKYNRWLYGLLLLIINNSFFLILPYLKGYFLYGRDDTLSHLGYVKDILDTGHFGASNFYPILHIIFSFIILITDIPRATSLYLMLIIFNLLYIFSIYILSYEFSDKLSDRLIFLLFSIPLIFNFFHATIHPSIISTYMIPLILKFYHIRKNKIYNFNYNVVFIFLTSMIAFLHPITTYFLIIIFIVFSILDKYNFRFLSPPFYKVKNKLNIKMVEIILIMSIITTTWYFSFFTIQNMFRGIIEFILYQSGSSVLSMTLTPLTRANLTYSQIMNLFINRYGSTFLILFISFIMSILVFINFKIKKKNIDSKLIYYFYAYVGTVMMSVIMMLGYYVEFNPIRIFRTPIILSVIFIGLFFINSFDDRIKFYSLALFSSITIILIILSLGNVYASPRTSVVNRQVTRMEIIGSQWFELYKNPDIPLVINNPSGFGLGPNSIIRRYEDFIFGVDSFDIERTNVSMIRLPSHFGYNEINYFGNLFNGSQRYIITLKYDRMAVLFFPENVRPLVYQFTDDDFLKLSNDPTINKIYSNDEFEIWLTSIN